jgi:hypothetical protein
LHGLAKSDGFNGAVVGRQRTPKGHRKIKSRDKYERHESGERCRETAEPALWTRLRAHGMANLATAALWSRVETHGEVPSMTGCDCGAVSAVTDRK